MSDKGTSAYLTVEKSQGVEVLDQVRIEAGKVGVDEGNVSNIPSCLGLAYVLFNFLSRKLPISCRSLGTARLLHSM